MVTTAACSGGKAPTDEAAERTVAIGVLVPLSGDLAPLGRSIRNAVQLAADQANDADRIRGWDVEVVVEDDAGAPATGLAAARTLVRNERLAAVVGTLNSPVAQEVQPVFDAAQVVMVSPANTAVALTGRDNLALQKRPYRTYFRVATTDDAQGPVAAEVAVQSLKVEKAAVLHDGSPYGTRLAAGFTERLEALGGKVVANETVAPGTPAPGETIGRLQPLRPDVIYYAGPDREAALLSSQSKLRGMKAPLFGGDGIYTASYIATAGAAAEGDLATSVGAPLEHLEGADGFAEAYGGARFDDPPSPYSAYAYDAANVVIKALAAVLPEHDAVDDDLRRALVDAVQRTKTTGVTGDIAFDDYGDIRTKSVTVYRVTNGEWKPQVTSRVDPP